MTARGRRPTPTSLKLLRGNPGKRPLNPQEPRPPVAVPRAPAHLSPEARKEWRRTGRLLAAMGLLAEIDRAALAMYCEAWARWAEAEQALQKYGLIVKSPSGLPMQSPYLAVANKAMEQIGRLLAEFGMSPASRTRVHAAVVGEESELGRLMNTAWDQFDRMG